MNDDRDDGSIFDDDLDEPSQSGTSTPKLLSSGTNKRQTDTNNASTLYPDEIIFDDEDLDRSQEFGESTFCNDTEVREPRNAKKVPKIDDCPDDDETGCEQSTMPESLDLSNRNLITDTVNPTATTDTQGSGKGSDTLDESDNEELNWSQDIPESQTINAKNKIESTDTGNIFYSGETSGKPDQNDSDELEWSQEIEDPVGEVATEIPKSLDNTKRVSKQEATFGESEREEPEVDGEYIEEKFSRKETSGSNIFLQPEVLPLSSKQSSHEDLDWDKNFSEEEDSGHLSNDFAKSSQTKGKNVHKDILAFLNDDGEEMNELKNATKLTKQKSDDKANKPILTPSAKRVTPKLITPSQAISFNITKTESIQSSTPSPQFKQQNRIKRFKSPRKLPPSPPIPISRSTLSSANVESDQLYYDVTKTLMDTKEIIKTFKQMQDLELEKAKVELSKQPSPVEYQEEREKDLLDEYVRVSRDLDILKNELESIYAQLKQQGIRESELDQEISKKRKELANLQDEITDSSWTWLNAIGTLLFLGLLVVVILIRVDPSFRNLTESFIKDLLKYQAVNPNEPIIS
ncbi:hypothetical protein BKA69DRAFT_919216 [Paraphysoderma sedebokerense]|nr:hypothetical protein BKA69DRAFT_919216 [Paraphysoderma sedebokerense]